MGVTGKVIENIMISEMNYQVLHIMWQKRIRVAVKWIFKERNESGHVTRKNENMEVNNLEASTTIP